MAEKENVDGSRLLKLVEAIAIKPEEAEKVVQGYRSKIDNTLDEHVISDLLASKIVARYAKMSGFVGGASGLVGVVPGIGTAIAAIGGALGDAAASMKLQVDMCMCLASAYGHDIHSEDARHLSFLIAAGGTLEKAGVEVGAKVASKAGVKLLRQYLRGAVLQAIKEFFKKLGIVFTRKALEKALPFGVGVVLGSSANYTLTKYVGKQAIGYFQHDRSM